MVGLISMGSIVVETHFFGSMFEDDKTPYVYVAHLPTKKGKETPR